MCCLGRRSGSGERSVPHAGGRAPRRHDPCSVVVDADARWREFSWEQHREFLASLLDLLTAFVAGVVFSIYPAWKDGREGRIDSIRQALRQFAEGFVVLALMAVVLIFFGVAWTWLAVGLLSAGVVIGAMSAMFGAMLETLVHAGEYLVKPLHWLVEQFMKHKTATVGADDPSLPLDRCASDRGDDEV